MTGAVRALHEVEDGAAELQVQVFAEGVQEAWQAASRCLQGWRCMAGAARLALGNTVATGLLPTAALPCARSLQDTLRTQKGQQRASA